MLEFLAPKRKQIFKAKWVSGDDENKTGFFKFSKPGEEKQNKTSIGNMSIKTGSVVWETKTTLPIKTDDICYYNNQKYYVVEVGTSDEENQIAHLYFNNNGNITKIITLQKAG